VLETPPALPPLEPQGPLTEFGPVEANLEETKTTATDTLMPLEAEKIIPTIIIGNMQATLLIIVLRTIINDIPS
jgi:hypothetical protein